MLKNLRQEWATPQAFFDEQNARYRYTVDACAKPWNAKLPRYWTEGDDGLVQVWDGERVWCNPPYTDIKPWVDQALRRRAEWCTLLLPSRTDRDWFHALLVESYKQRAQIEFLPYRLSFEPPPGVRDSAPREASILVHLWSNQ